MGYNPGVKSKRSPIGQIQQASLFGEEECSEVAPSKPEVRRPFDDEHIVIGTSAFTAAGWPGSFYLPGMKSSDYLTYYASRFRTVEIDSTYYRTPSESTVANWDRKTSLEFILRPRFRKS